MTNKEALELSKLCHELDGKAEEWLKHKCNWEHMTRMAVIIDWEEKIKNLLLQDLINYKEYCEDAISRLKSKQRKRTWCSHCGCGL